MALLEAMAAELPCVATMVSGTTQVVLPGITGLLVPPGDTRALRDAMLEVLAHPAGAQQMGRAGRRRVEREFSATTQAMGHIARFEADGRTIGWSR